MSVPLSRRVALASLAGAAVGAAGSAAAESLMMPADPTGPLPFYGGYASAIRPDLRGPAGASVTAHWWGDRTAAPIALTFDDGPHPDWTPRLLDALAGEDVVATFFVKGTALRDHPRVHRESVGRHELANHTMTHPDLARLDAAAVAQEIVDCSQVMQDVLGVRPRCFRPPYGHLAGSTLLAAAEAGLPLVLWSAQVRESRFVDHPDGVVDDLIQQVDNGSIVLAHDNGNASRLIGLEHIVPMIRGLKDRGHTFVTVSTLLGAPGPS